MKKTNPPINWQIILSVLAFIFSIISLVINYYNQFGKSADLDFQMGNRLVCFSSNHRLKCTNTITIFNSGAQTGSVYKIKGELLNLTSKKKVELNWNMFVEEENTGVKGKEFKPFYSFDSWAKTILIQPRSASQKEIQFTSNGSYDFTEGKYNLNLYYYTGTEKTFCSHTSSSFTISKEAIELWKSSKLHEDTLNNISNSSVNFNLMPNEF